MLRLLEENNKAKTLLTRDQFTTRERGDGYNIIYACKMLESITPNINEEKPHTFKNRD